VEPSSEKREPGSGPIGVFDSGLGGLSVLLEVRRALPHEDLVYVADSGHAPYGDKPADHINRRAQAILEFLVQHGAKAVVVACNTATGIAVDELRARWSVPIVGIEPAVKPAAGTTKTGVVGVLATRQTIASPRFARLVRTFGSGVDILPQACPGLVERVEAGDVASESTRALVGDYVRPLIAQGADTLVLGCTHYPFLTAVIADVAGPGVTIIDPAAAVARELKRRLMQEGLESPQGRPGGLRFLTSGPPGPLQQALGRLGFPSEVETLPV
jgi:glutamate racemase